MTLAPYQRRITDSTHDRFLAAIRRGRIRTGREAAELFGVTETTIYNWLRRARASGHRIETGTGEAWTIRRKA